jgi:hypothetical protein
LATSASRVDDVEGASERRFWAGGVFDSAGIWEANAAAGQDLRFLSFFAGSTVQRNNQIRKYKQNKKITVAYKLVRKSMATGSSA